MPIMWKLVSGQFPDLQLSTQAALEDLQAQLGPQKGPGVVEWELDSPLEPT